MLILICITASFYNSKTISIKGYSWPKAHDLHKWRQNVYLWMGLLKFAGDLDKPQTALRKASTICSLDSKNTNLRKYFHQIDTWYHMNSGEFLSAHAWFLKYPGSSPGREWLSSITHKTGTIQVTWVSMRGIYRCLFHIVNLKVVCTTWFNEHHFQIWYYCRKDIGCIINYFITFWYKKAMRADFSIYLYLI